MGPVEKLIIFVVIDHDDFCYIYYIFLVCNANKTSRTEHAYDYVGTMWCVETKALL